jgi:hypothetical protein
MCQVAEFVMYQQMQMFLALMLKNQNIIAASS